MKKYFNISYFLHILGWSLLAVIVAYSLFIIFYNVYAPAEIFYNPFTLEYDENTYIEFEPKIPYSLIDDDSFQGKKERTYVKNMIVPLIYFEPYSVVFDKKADFINLHHFDRILVKENFIYPELETNEVIEVWMSLSSEYKIIKDKETVTKIVESAKSNGKVKLDKEFVEYIKEYSFDNHCFYLRYKNCPVVEEFHIKETEDGKYVVEQYPIEKYKASYREDKAHQ